MDHKKTAYIGKNNFIEVMECLKLFINQSFISNVLNLWNYEEYINLYDIFTYIAVIAVIRMV